MRENIKEQAVKFAGIYSEIGLRTMKANAYNRIGEYAKENAMMELGELNNPLMKDELIKYNNELIEYEKEQIRILKLAIKIRNGESIQ